MMRAYILSFDPLVQHTVAAASRCASSPDLLDHVSLGSDREGREGGWGGGRMTGMPLRDGRTNICWKRPSPDFLLAASNAKTMPADSRACTANEGLEARLSGPWTRDLLMLPFGPFHHLGRTRWTLIHRETEQPAQRDAAASFIWGPSPIGDHPRPGLMRHPGSNIK